MNSTPSRRRIGITTGLLLGALAAPAPARAEAASLATPAAPEAHRFAVSGLLGAGTPLGYAGVEGAYSPWSWLSLSAGVGVANFFAPTVSVASMARLEKRFGRDQKFFAALGYGMSLSRYTVDSSFLPFGDLASQNPYWQGNLFWHNTEVSFGWRPVRSPLFLRTFLGIGAAANPDAFVCIRECESDRAKPELVLPYTGVALGWRLP